MSNEYRVTWTIDLEADDPEHAARIARAIQHDSLSSANVFHVDGERIDLDEIDESKGQES